MPQDLAHDGHEREPRLEATDSRRSRDAICRKFRVRHEWEFQQFRRPSRDFQVPPSRLRQQSAARRNYRTRRWGFHRPTPSRPLTGFRDISAEIPLQRTVTSHRGQAMSFSAA